MGRHYGQLSLDERCTIAQLCKAGQSISEIAADLDRAPSTVSRELKRKCGAQVGYKPAYANEQARARRWTGSRLEHDAELRGLVLGQLRRGWSPEQIAGRLRQQKAATTISHGSIYRVIYAQVRRTNDGAWRHYLPKGRYKRCPPGNRRRSCDDLVKRRVSIDLRPQAVERRTEAREPGAEAARFVGEKAAGERTCVTAFVLDVSVTIAWCFKDEAPDDAWALLDRLSADNAIVPGIWSAEVANVLVEAERRRRIDKAEARIFIVRLMALPIVLEETAPGRMLGEVLSIGHETRLAAYDTLYLDLTIGHGMPPATTDLSLRTAARRMRVAILPA